MARTYYEIPPHNVPGRALRIFVCDTEDDLPQADSIYAGDFFFIRTPNSDANSPSLFFGSAAGGTAREITPVHPENWEIIDDEDIDPADDVTTVDEAIEQLMARVQILEDNM